MTALDTLRTIAADPASARIKQPTAREIIEGRIGRKLPAVPDMAPDERQAVKMLAIQLIKNRLTR